jgi:hypothetical protein
MLDVEIQTYERERANLVLKAEGKYVLIKGDRIIEIFECDVDAVAHGFRTLGHVPFLVRKIAKVDEEVTI